MVFMINCIASCGRSQTGKVLTLNVNVSDPKHVKIQKIVGSILLNAVLGANVSFIACGLTVSTLPILAGAVAGSIVGIALFSVRSTSKDAWTVIRRLDCCKVAKGAAKIFTSLFMTGALCLVGLNLAGYSFSTLLLPLGIVTACSTIGTAAAVITLFNSIRTK